MHKACRWRYEKFVQHSGWETQRNTIQRPIAGVFVFS